MLYILMSDILRYLGEFQIIIRVNRNMAETVPLLDSATLIEFFNFYNRLLNAERT